jgi:hypothetical protein
MATPGTDHKSFFRSLYDFSFGTFVTSRVLKVLYGLVVILYSLTAVVAFLLLLIKGGVIGIVLAIVFVPLLYFIYLVVTRLLFESLMVVFRIGDDVRAIAQRREGPGDGDDGHPAPTA